MAARHARVWLGQGSRPDCRPPAATAARCLDAERDSRTSRRLPFDARGSIRARPGGSRPAGEYSIHTVVDALGRTLGSHSRRRIPTTAIATAITHGRRWRPVAGGHVEPPLFSPSTYPMTLPAQNGGLARMKAFGGLFLEAMLHDPVERRGQTRNCRRHVLCSSWRIALRVSTAVSRRNAHSAVNISWKRTPKLNRSER
jgi:hypothetical protein